jgi:hypothetical protein
MNEDRIVRQLDKMVGSGRMARDEADRLRAAQGTPRFEEVMGEIRARHASAHLTSAVEGGEMTREEADEQLERIRRGEHPKGLRARLRSHRTASRQGGDAG